MKILETKLPVLLVGAPGVGKTAVVKDSADHIEVLLLSSSTEEDIGGLPYHVNGIEKRTVPPFVVRLQEAAKEGKSTALFLDEIDKARRDVADTLLSLILDPQSFGLPEGIKIRAAANPPEWGGGSGVSDAMLSRFIVVDFTIDPEKQFEFWKKRYKDKNDILEMVDKLIQHCSHHGMVCVEGDGYNKRITCPRTMTMVLDSMAEGYGMENDVASGLLTKAFSSLFVNSKRTQKTRERSIKHLSKAKKVSTAHNPLRIPLL